MKKLSPKERDELVTKGYLEDTLNARFDVFETRLDQKFDEKFDQKFDEKFALWKEEMERYVTVLVERSDEKFRIMTEGFFEHQERIVRIEEHVGLR